MKVKVEEFDGCFSIDMEPETVAEAAILLRVAINGKKEVRGIYCSAYTDLTMSASVVIGKRKDTSSQI